MNRCQFGILALFALVLSLPSQARWATELDADISIDAVSKMIVHRDGSYEMSETQNYTILKERGVEDMQMVSLSYDANRTSLFVENPRVINGTKVIPTPKEVIETKPIASGHEGLTSLMQINVPFRGVQIGSKISYTIKEIHKAPYIPGVFYTEDFFGLEYLSRSDVLEITSEIPLVHRENGGQGLIQTEEKKIGNKYYLKFTLLKPVFRRLVDEPFPKLERSSIPIVEIASNQNWEVISKAAAEKFSQLFTEPLPQSFQLIADAANLKPTPKEKMEYVIAQIIANVHYLGDWRAEKNYYFPRTLKEIAETKQGDCKDLSFATAAILRKLGIKANIAWVRRGRAEEPPLLPTIDYFNHAITYAEVEGKQYWLDPTNEASFVGDPLPDIADRYALVTDTTRKELTHIPPSSSPSGTEITAYLSFRSPGFADVIQRLRIYGSWATDLINGLIKLPKEKQRLALLSIVDPARRLQGLNFFDEQKQIDSSTREVSTTFVFNTEGNVMQTSLGPAVPVAAPMNILPFFVKTDNRVSDVSLGQTGLFEQIVHYDNFKVVGALPANCTAESKWAKFSRTFEPKATGVVVRDKIDMLAKSVALSEIASEDYETFQRNLKKCVQSQSLIFNYLPVGQILNPNLPIMTDPLIEDKTQLYEKAASILSDTEGDMKDYARAKFMLLEHLKSNPKDVKAYGELSLATLYQGFTNSKYKPESMDEAKEILSLGKALSPNDADLKVVEAKLLLAKNNDIEAQKLVEAVLKENPNHDGAKIVLASIYLRSPNTAPAAIKICQDALADPTKSDKKLGYVNVLLDAYQATGNFTEAEKMYLAKIDLKPNSGQSMNNFATFLFGRARYSDAEKYARKAIELSDLTVAHKTLSDVLVAEANQASKTNPLKAIQMYEEALQHNQANLDAHSALASLYDFRGRQTKDPSMLMLAQKHNNIMAAIMQAKAKRLGMGGRMPASIQQPMQMNQ